MFSLECDEIKISLYYTNHLPRFGGVLSTKTPVEEEDEHI